MPKIGSGNLYLTCQHEGLRGGRGSAGETMWWKLWSRDSTKGRERLYLCQQGAGLLLVELGGGNGLFSQVSAITQAAPAPARACAPAREAGCVRKTLKSLLFTPLPLTTSPATGGEEERPSHPARMPVQAGTTSYYTRPHTSPRASPPRDEQPNLLLPRCLPFHHNPKAVAEP